VGGQRHAPAALSPGETRYPSCRRLGGPQGRSGRARKISPLTGIRSPDRPACSESVYRLSYPGPRRICCIIIKVYTNSISYTMSTHFVEDSQSGAAHRRKFCMTVRMEQETQYHQCRLSGDTIVCHLNI
jgi:hypothetical protein